MKKLPLIFLVTVSILMAIGMGLLEMDGAEGEAVLGTRVLIWTINLGGIALFWIAADIKKKNKRNGQYALMMALSVRMFAYLYILHIAGFDVWMLGEIATSKISDYISKLMLFGNTVILFCERMVNYYADPEDEFRKRLKEAEIKANEWEIYANECESKLNVVRMQLNECESKLNVVRMQLNECESKPNALESKLNAARMQVNVLESKLNASETISKKNESIDNVIQAFIDVPFTSGNNTYYLSSKEMKLRQWPRGNKQPLIIAGQKIKHPKSQIRK